MSSVNLDSSAHYLMHFLSQTRFADCPVLIVGDYARMIRQREGSSPHGIYLGKDLEVCIDVGQTAVNPTLPTFLAEMFPDELQFDPGAGKTLVKRSRIYIRFHDLKHLTPRLYPTVTPNSFVSGDGLPIAPRVELIALGQHEGVLTQTIDISPSPILSLETPVSGVPCYQARMVPLMLRMGRWGFFLWTIATPILTRIIALFQLSDLVIVMMFILMIIDLGSLLWCW